MKNILVIATYTGIGGGESLQLNLMRALDDKRYSLHLLTPRRGPFAEAAASLGVTTHFLPFRGTSTFFIPAIWSWFPVVSRLYPLLQEYEISAVLSDYHSLPFFLPAATYLGVPVISKSLCWCFPIHTCHQRFFQHRTNN